MSKNIKHTRILVIDDSRFILAMVEDVLVRAGCEVVCFEGSVEAISYVRKHTVDLVIIDDNLSEMDGKRMVKKLRQSPCCVDTPILVMTSDKSEAEKNQFKKHGANGSILKPLDPTKLLTAVSSILEECV